MTARPAAEQELPRSAARLLAVPGWRGTASCVRGRPVPDGELVESVVVRLERPAVGARAVAIFEDGFFTSAYCWSAWGSLQHIGYRALTAWLKKVGTL